MDLFESCRQGEPFNQWNTFGRTASFNYGPYLHSYAVLLSRYEFSYALDKACVSIDSEFRSAVVWHVEDAVRDDSVLAKVAIRRFDLQKQSFHQ